MIGEFHRIDGKLNIYVSLYFAAADTIEVFLRCLRNNGIAIIVEPIEQRPDQDVILIFNDSGVEERAHYRPTTLKLLEKAVVIDAEPKHLGGCVEIGTVNKQCDLAAVSGHLLKFMIQINKATGAARDMIMRATMYVPKDQDQFLWLLANDLVLSANDLYF